MMGRKPKKRKSSSRGKNPATDAASDIVCRDQPAAAKYAGVNTRTIRRWKEEGMPVTKEGLCIKAVLDLWKDKGRGLSDDARQKEQATTLEHKEKKIEKLTLEIQQMRIEQGELFTPADVLNFMETHLGPLRRELTSRFRRIARTVTGLSLPEATEVLRGEDKAILDMMGKISDAAQKSATKEIEK